MRGESEKSLPEFERPLDLWDEIDQGVWSMGIGFNPGLGKRASDCEHSHEPDWFPRLLEAYSFLLNKKYGMNLLLT
jgi:hypothetical protein